MKTRNQLSTIENLVIQVKLVTIGALVLTLMGCTVTILSPYDEKLFNDTEAFFKKANAMIEDGKSASPLKDEDRNKIDKPEEHPGHITAFSTKYDSLILDTDALILRSIVNSQKLDKVGVKLHDKITDVVDKSISSSCQELHDELGKVDLTAMNFVDLKCIVIKWKEQHSDKILTQNKQILKKANWEGRKIVLFDTILAIQRAEGFKKTK